MKKPSVSPNEMRKLANICESDLDAMLAGLVPDSDPRHGAIARFVQELCDAFPERSTADLEDAHIASMLQVSRLVTANGESAEAPSSEALWPENQASGLPPYRRQTMLQTLFAHTGAKVAASSIALVMAFSGVAVAGVLPDPIQDAVADTVRVVGVNLPGGTAEIESPDVPEIESPEVPEIDIDDPADADDQSDNDGQVDEDDADEATESSDDDDDEDSDESDVIHNDDDDEDSNGDMDDDASDDEDEDDDDSDDDDDDDSEDEDEDEDDGEDD